MKRTVGLLAILLAVTGQAATEAQTQSGPVVDHTTVGGFYNLTPEQIAGAAALRVLFIDHSVGQNISEGLNCYGAESVAAAPSYCKRFDHVDPALSANPDWFQFGVQYDRSRWPYQQGGGSYWREWPGYVEELLTAQPDWDVVIMMPSYLVAPNGGWQPFEELEAAHPDITFVYATSSLPRGAEGGTAREQVMQQFNADARAYALAHGKPVLDVADILSHDYAGGACFDTRDGIPYCNTPTNCENLPDDGVDIPAICQHYTSELYGGHLGNVSGGMLRMAQAMWLLMAEIATGTPPPLTPTPTGDPVSPTSTPTLPLPPTATATPTTPATATAATPPTASPPTASPSPTAPHKFLWLPYLFRSQPTNRRG